MDTNSEDAVLAAHWQNLSTIGRGVTLGVVGGVVAAGGWALASHLVSHHRVYVSQQILSLLDLYVGKITGDLDGNTAKAILDFQRHVNAEMGAKVLSETGKLDDRTYQALLDYNPVSWYQGVLGYLGFMEAEPGSLYSGGIDRATRKAVRLFRKAHGLGSSSTLDAIFKAYIFGLVQTHDLQHPEEKKYMDAGNEATRTSPPQRYSVADEVWVFRMKAISDL